MQLRENVKYDIATVSSMGIRITPVGRMPVATSHLFEMQSTSAETNVLNVTSSLGGNAVVLTKFVKESAIAQFIKNELRARNIQYIGKDVDAGGAWGYRHQINIADSGFGPRGPRVLNDRAGEVGRTITAQDFDLEQVFAKDGVKILHLSGLFFALSPETMNCCLDVARYAKQCGTRISFDLNYRASFWKGREEELRRSFTEVASLADILIGNEEDFQLALGLEGPEAGGQGLAKKIDGFKGLIGRAKEQFPNAQIFATTLREVFSANAHNWGAIINAEGEWFVEEPREIQILDRIGGGDGFAGGLLYGLIQGWDAEKSMHFGWATGAMAASMTTDYATCADEEQVWSIYSGNARVKR